MLRLMDLSTMIGPLLAGCSAPVTSPRNSIYACDRNGDREQRIAC
jgi:hypothetical protein